MGPKERGFMDPHSLPPAGTRLASCEFTLKGEGLSYRVLNVGLRFCEVLQLAQGPRP